MKFILSFFSSEGKINRSQYLLRVILIFVINIIIALPLLILGFEEKQLIITIIPPTIILIYLNIEKRIKSIGWDTDATILYVIGSFIPFLNLILGLILLLKRESKSDIQPQEPESFPPDKNFSLFLIVLIVSFLISLTIGKKNEKSPTIDQTQSNNYSNSQEKKEPTQVKKFSMINDQYEKEAKQRSIESSNIKVNELIKNFHYLKDDFENTGWYIHKNQTNIKTGLKVLLNDKGFLYIEALAITKTPLLFMKISIKGNSGIFTTDEIPEYTENSVKVDSNFSYRYREYRNFLKDGIKIASFINENINGEIKIRLHGHDSNYDFVLSSKDKKAISDALMLKSLINKIN